MPKRGFVEFVALSACVASSFIAPLAHAHIKSVGEPTSRGGDIKMNPCDGNRGDGPVYTYAPGTEITLTINEFVPHPSYFRIAFDNNGDADFMEPRSIKPIDPTRACPFNSSDQCGQPDYCNVVSTTGGPTVLWDNLDPHLAGDVKNWSWNVKLPDVECDNCVLQIIQVMEDTVHGAYCPTGPCDGSLEDVYHLCVDIKLQKGATNGPGVTTDPIKNTGIDCLQMSSGSQPSAGSGGSEASGAGSGGSMSSSSAGTSAAGTSAAAGVGGMSMASAGSAASAGTSGSMMSAGASAPVGGSSGTTSTAGTSASSAQAGSGSPPAVTTGNPTTVTPASSPAAQSKSSGGCAVGSGNAMGFEAFGWFMLVAGLRRRRRARA